MHSESGALFATNESSHFEIRANPELKPEWVVRRDIVLRLDETSTQADVAYASNLRCLSLLDDED